MFTFKLYIKKCIIKREIFKQVKFCALKKIIYQYINIENIGTSRWVTLRKMNKTNMAWQCFRVVYSTSFLVRKDQEQLHTVVALMWLTILKRKKHSYNRYKKVLFTTLYLLKNP